MGKIPEGWLLYSALGRAIPGTRFIAFKVPLREELNSCLPPEERFGPAQLMQLCPKLSLVVDLTNTHRYYNSNVFQDNSISHVKMKCPGQQIPPDSLAKRFNAVVDNFLRKNENTDGLIGVHCTHGVNRTGYFICRYMVERMGMSPESAVAAFTEARGHGIRRENYVQDLQRVKERGPSDMTQEVNPGLLDDIESVNEHRTDRNWRPKFTNYKERFSKERHGGKMDNRNWRPNLPYDNERHTARNHKDRWNNSISNTTNYDGMDGAGFGQNDPALDRNLRSNLPICDGVDGSVRLQNDPALDWNFRKNLLNCNGVDSAERRQNDPSLNRNWRSNLPSCDGKYGATSRPHNPSLDRNWRSNRPNYDRIYSDARSQNEKRDPNLTPTIHSYSRKESLVNSGVDFGYDPPLSSGYNRGYDRHGTGNMDRGLDQHHQKPHGTRRSQAWRSRDRHRARNRNVEGNAGRLDEK